LINFLSRVRVNNCIICSVVPRATRRLKKDLSRLLNKKPLVLGENIKVPIKNIYLKPGQVGQDRLANAYAGVKLYAAPIIIVDFGTAITFDVISKRKEYLGGLILPGLDISLDGLANRTALLPKIKLEKPRGLIGRDTKNSILSGIIYGFAALTDDLTKRIKNRIGKQAKVIGTGGGIDLIKYYCKGIDRVDKDLTLKGLNLIYSRHSEGRIL
jgi:type III pantothenate kinase